MPVLRLRAFVAIPGFSDNDRQAKLVADAAYGFDARLCGTGLFELFAQADDLHFERAFADFFANLAAEFEDLPGFQTLLARLCQGHQQGAFVVGNIDGRLRALQLPGDGVQREFRATVGARDYSPRQA
jgi:hypothetical protein